MGIGRICYNCSYLGALLPRKCFNFCNLIASNYVHLKRRQFLLIVVSLFSADLGPPCRKSCPRLPDVPNAFYNCKTNFTSISGSAVVVGTECRSLCAVGYGFAPGSVRKRVCLPDGRWSGEEPICILEKQFALFLDRFSTKSTYRPHVCIIADEVGSVKKVDYRECQDTSGKLNPIFNRRKSLFVYNFTLCCLNRRTRITS